MEGEQEGRRVFTSSFNFVHTALPTLSSLDFPFTNPAYPSRPGSNAKSLVKTWPIKAATYTYYSRASVLRTVNTHPALTVFAAVFLGCHVHELTDPHNSPASEVLVSFGFVHGVGETESSRPRAPRSLAAEPVLTQATASTVNREGAVVITDTLRELLVL